MTHDIEEETNSESSYTRVSACGDDGESKSVNNEVSSAVVSDNEDTTQLEATQAAVDSTDHDDGDEGEEEEEQGEVASSVGEEGTESESESEIGTKSGAWKKDDTFFFSFVTFRVEDRLFRVPKDAFENQSEHFRKLLTSVSTNLEDNSTGDINEPIFLDGIEKDAFRNLLRLMYPPPTTSSFTGPILLDREQWIKILDLAQKWGFAGIRDLAIKQLELAKFEEVEKLELALKYEIKQWYADAYNALAKRPEPLSVEEGRRLGLELSLKMARVRERRITRIMKLSSGENVANGSSGFAAFGGSYMPFGKEPMFGGVSCGSGSKPSKETSHKPSSFVDTAAIDTADVKKKRLVIPIPLGSGKKAGLASESGTTAHTPQVPPRPDATATATANTPDTAKRICIMGTPPPSIEFGKTSFPPSAFSSSQPKGSTSSDDSSTPSNPPKADVPGLSFKGRKNGIKSSVYFDEPQLMQDIKETFAL